MRFAAIPANHVFWQRYAGTGFAHVFNQVHNQRGVFLVSLCRRVRFSRAEDHRLLLGDSICCAQCRVQYRATRPSRFRPTG